MVPEGIQPIVPQHVENDCRIGSSLCHVGMVLTDSVNEDGKECERNKWNGSTFKSLGKNISTRPMPKGANQRPIFENGTMAGRCRADTSR